MGIIRLSWDFIKYWSDAPCVDRDLRRSKTAVDVLNGGMVLGRLFRNGVITIPFDDNTKLSAADYRDRLYLEISNKRKEARRKESLKGKKSTLVPDEA